ncbi:uncharacterized protein CFAP97D2 [Ascaphus truei]|uniref:uncharacterized protein CFAP97D2 n=1 Tax=Ascaphus truei TaxID=8439 RepID=UPI003F5AD9B0
MHRSYQPTLPCGNKYLQLKWDKTYYDEHKKKVQTAKPMVDTNSPQTYVHLNLKLKKLKLEEERLSVIERDNHLLLEKMSTIMRTKGRIDNKNDYEAKSLNKEKREQELLRVYRENQTILDRISKCEPQYRVEKWHEDWVKAEKYMDSIARYPRGWYLIRQGKMSKEKRKSSKKESEKVSTAEEESVNGESEEVEKDEFAGKKDGKKRDDASKGEAANSKADKAKETDSKRKGNVTFTSQAKEDTKEEGAMENETREDNLVGSEDFAGGKARNEDDTGKEVKSEKLENEKTGAGESEKEKEEE